jgi:4-hydroxy-4-methyl-2-oxoglutarate aldolase
MTPRASEAGMDEQLRGRLLNLTTALMSDALMQLGEQPRIMDGGIRPVLPFSKGLGRAITVAVDFEPTPLRDGQLADSGMLRVLDEFRTSGRAPGWALVLAPSVRDRAMLGETFSMWGRSLGLTGLFSDGAARDSHELAGRRFPVFSRGLTPLGPYNAMRVRAVDIPVTVGGVEVRPGDVVSGDHDGIVVFDYEQAADVCRLGTDYMAAGAAFQAQLGGGATYELAAAAKRGSAAS